MHSGKKIVFDTDILRSFGSINKLDEINKLFKGQIVIPDAVLAEIDKWKFTPGLLGIRNYINKKIKDETYELLEITSNTPEYNTFAKLIKGDIANGIPKIGNGEAACLAIAMHNDKIISSSNLKDVYQLSVEKRIINIPTLELLKLFFYELDYTCEEVNSLKDKLISLGRIIPKEDLILKK